MPIYQKSCQKKIKFTRNGKEFWVDFLYPWLPPRCFVCEKWGHLDNRCVETKRISTAGTEKKWVEKPKDSQIVVEVTTQEITDTSQAIEKCAEKEIVQSIVNVVEETGVWSYVSPSKVGRSLSKAEITEERPIISASKYSVLNIDDDAEEGEVRDSVKLNDVVAVIADTAQDNVSSNKPEMEIVVEKSEGEKPTSTRNKSKKKKNNSETSTRQQRTLFTLLQVGGLTKKLSRCQVFHGMCAVSIKLLNILWSVIGQIVVRCSLVAY